MEESPKKKKFFHRLPVRIIAGFLTIIMLFSVAVVILSNVSIQHVDTLENVTAANNYLADNNDYIEKNLFSRAGRYISGRMKAPETLQEHYEYAEALIAREDYKGALPHVNACIALYEGGNDALLADLWMKKGCLLAMLGEYSAAIEGIDKSISIGGATGDAYLVKAQIYLLLQDSEKALDCLGEYLGMNPSDLQAQASMAELYSQMGRYEESVACYTAVIADKSSPYYSPGMYLGRAGSLLLMGEIDQAEEDIQAYCDEIGTVDGTATFLRGMCAMQRGDYTAASDLFADAIDLGHDSPALCYEQMTQCYFLESDFEAAIETGKKALDAKGQVSQPGMLYRQMGVSAMALQQNTDAIEYFSQAIQRGGYNGEDYYYRAICYMGEEEYGLAIEDFTAAIQAEAMLQDCYYYRGMCYYETGETDAAIPDFQMAVQTGDDEEIAQMAREILDALGASMGD